MDETELVAQPYIYISLSAPEKKCPGQKPKRSALRGHNKTNVTAKRLLPNSSSPSLQPNLPPFAAMDPTRAFLKDVKRIIIKVISLLFCRSLLLLLAFGSFET